MEIAVTVVLLIGAGLLLKSFVHLCGADVGCVTNNVLTLDLNLPAQKYGSPQKVNAFNEILLEELRACPASVLLLSVQICLEKDLEVMMYSRLRSILR